MRTAQYKWRTAERDHVEDLLDRVQFVIDVNGTTADKFPANDGAVTQSGELSVNTLEKMPEKTSEKTSEKILYLISEKPRITTRELVDIIWNS